MSAKIVDNVVADSFPGIASWQSESAVSASKTAISGSTSQTACWRLGVSEAGVYPARTHPKTTTGRSTARSP